MPDNQRPAWAEAIRRRRIELEKSQEVLADEAATSQTWISQVERGSHDPTGSTAARFFRLLEALRWTPAEFQLATGLPIPEQLTVASNVRQTGQAAFGRRSIPVYDLVSGGNGADGGTTVNFIDVPDDWVGEYSAYIVDGDSMAPIIASGSTIIVKNQDYASPKNIIVCWVEDHGMLVKYLDRTENGLYVLASFNPMYLPIWAKNPKIYGVVREVRTAVEIINGNH